MTKRTPAVPLAAKAFLIGAALVSSMAFAQAKDRTVLVANADPAMVAAISKAQATLDTFLATAAKPPAGTSGYKLKVAVADGADTEHFWVLPFRATAKGFEGVLANEPNIVSNVKMGQTIKFIRKDISDWGYLKNERQVGSFTVCALFKKMSKDEVAYYRNNHGFDC